MQLSADGGVMTSRPLQLQVLISHSNARDVHAYSALGQQSTVNEKDIGARSKDIGDGGMEADIEKEVMIPYPDIITWH